MYRLIIVEDEQMIRESLVNNIDWESVECSVVNSFESAEDALDWLEQTKNKPDIIITDIRMNLLSGLDLAIAVKEMEMDCKTIIVTGYDDISYAQSAIIAGVKDFILKPVNTDKLIETVNRVTREIRKDRAKTEAFDKLRQRIIEDIPLLRQQYIGTLMSNIGASKVYTDARKENFLGLDFNKSSVIVIAVSDFWDQEKNSDIFVGYEIKLAVKDRLERMGKTGGIYISMKENDEIYALLLKTDTDMAEEFAEGLVDELNDSMGISVSIGISNTAHQSSDIGELIKQGKEALGYRFYLGKNSIIRYDEINTLTADKFVAFDRICYEDMYVSVSVGDVQQAKQRLKNVWTKYFRQMPEAQMRNCVIMILSDYLMLSQSHKMDSPLYSYLTYYERVEKAEDSKQLYSYLMEVTVDISEKINEIYNSTTGQIVNAAKNYIGKNYMQAITLSDVAKHAIVSEKYLCKVLKMKTGKTFKEIHNEIRIQKAIKLLEETNMKTYEIAEKVGLADSRYFGQLFKKVTGMTPREFKNR